MSNQRFERFNDFELYIIKRAFIEATKWIYAEDELLYTESELKMLDDLLAEAIDNLKMREFSFRKYYDEKMKDPEFRKEYKEIENGERAEESLHHHERVV